MTVVCVTTLSLHQGEPAPPGAVWPLPQTWTRSNKLKTINPISLQFVTNTDGCDVIEKAIERYKVLLDLTKDGKPDNDYEELESLDISVTDTRCGSDVYPALDDSEKCK